MSINSSATDSETSNLGYRAVKASILRSYRVNLAVSQCPLRDPHDENISPSLTSSAHSSLPPRQPHTQPGPRLRCPPDSQRAVPQRPARAHRRARPWRYPCPRGPWGYASSSARTLCCRPTFTQKLTSLQRSPAFKRIDLRWTIPGDGSLAYIAVRRLS